MSKLRSSWQVLAAVLIIGVYCFGINAVAVEAMSAEKLDSVKKGTPYYLKTAPCTTSGTAQADTSSSGDTYVLGDSISFGLHQDGLEQKIGGNVKINYDGGRSITAPGMQVKQTAMDAVTADKEFISHAGRVVIVLGTNQSDDPFGDNMHKLLQKLRGEGFAPNAKYYWVDIGATTTKQVAGWNARNKIIYDNAATEKYTVISRYKAIFGPDANPLNITPGQNFPGLGNEDAATYGPGNIHGAYPPLSAAIVAALGGQTNATAANATPTSATTTPTTAFSPDPAAVKMYEENLKPLIEPLIPLYQRAAQAAGLADWQILPALHNMESGLSKTNPSSNTGFRTPFQMNAGSLANHGLNLSDPVFQPGHALTDDEFVKAATYAAQFWLLSDAKTLGIDASKPVGPTEAGKMIAAYKSGAGSVWFTGKADFNLHAYAWAGFDTTDQHKLPMAWGPGSPFGDEVAGTRINRVGAATLFMLLKGGNFAAAATSSTCSNSQSNLSGGGPFQAVTGSHDELVQKVLSSANVKFGNSGNAGSQKDDVQHCLTDTTLAAFAAMAEQSGVKILVNAIATDHGGCTKSGGSDHNFGRAIDIGYYGNGTQQHNADGDKLFKFLYDNRKALQVSQIIWKMPPDGYQCVTGGEPVDCYAYYKAPTMDQHYHHIHVGFLE